jgi:hypothetical protein
VTDVWKQEPARWRGRVAALAAEHELARVQHALDRAEQLRLDRAVLPTEIEKRDLHREIPLTTEFRDEHG